MINFISSNSNINIDQNKNGQPTSSSSTSIANSKPVPAAPSSGTIHSNSTMGLESGQVIQGEIIDVNNNEVSVKFEDGRVITGRLEESTSLTIGEHVTFRVENVSLKNLTLKILSKSQFQPLDTTIEKALEAAGLGKNDRNRALVKALINQKMPIDKNTIALLMKQSLAFKDVSIDTLVFMNKYHLPVTDENIAYLNSLGNSQNNMVNDIINMAHDVSNFLETLSNSPLEEIIAKTNDLLHIVLEQNLEQANTNIGPDGTVLEQPILTAEAGHSQQEVANSLENRPFSNILDEKIATNSGIYIMDDSILNSEERQALVKFIESNPAFKNYFTDSTLKTIINGSAQFHEVASALHQALISNDSSNHFMKDTILATVQKVLSAYESVNNENTMNQLQTLLSPSERMNLLEAFSGYSISREMKDQILSGKITPREILEWVRNNLEGSTDSTLKRLYSNKEFKSLIEEELIKKWTLTPKELTKKDAVDEYYQNMTKQLENLKQVLSNASQNTNDGNKNLTNNLQQNLDFMGRLNEFFTYFQLPIKLKEQIANSKLFVYTRKKEKRTIEDGISVLLHLDMEHLGPLDIHVDLHRNNIISKFYANDGDTLKVLSSHMELLEEALMKKGFTLNAEVLVREKDIDLVQEFANLEDGPSSFQRYNFDIKA